MKGCQMMLAIEQLQALKTFVDANYASIYEQSTANLLNETASPLFLVYKSTVSEAEIMLNGFDWLRVDNLSVGRARIWDWLFRVNGAIDPSKQNIRNGLNECWKGTAADLAVRAAIYLHCFRSATVAEKLFATGAGTAPDVNGNGPATMGFEGSITLNDLIQAANS